MNMKAYCFRLTSVLPMLVLLVSSACAPTATPAQMRAFGRGLEECDRLVFGFPQRPDITEGAEIDGRELAEIVNAMSPDNLTPWGNYSKFMISGPMTFYAKDRAVCV